MKMTSESGGGGGGRERVREREGGIERGERGGREREKTLNVLLIRPPWAHFRQWRFARVRVLR